MIYGSVCSGIEAASVAWEPSGWRPAFFAEIEKFPNRVLAHHFPEVPNYGDITKFKEWPDHAVDILIGGTPCQDVSQANVKGKGLDGSRSGLAFTYADICARYAPEWIIWENVPAILGARHFNGFRTFIKTLGQCGYTCSWRILDARTFGLADQPRKRIYVVGHRDYRCAAAVLLEPAGTEGHREKKASAAPVFTARGGMAYDDRTPVILEEDGPRIATPLEWERAMGFPDNWTLLPGSDALGPRYKALGNSMSVPVVRWIGRRIKMVEELL